MAGTEIVYKCSFKDYSGNDCELQICQDGFTGSTTEVDGGPSPVVLKMMSEGDGKFTHIKATECEIQLVSSTSLQYLSVFLSTNKTYYVRVIRETVPLWTGWVNPEYYNEPFISPPFITNIHATDGLAELKNITLPRPGDTVLSCKQSMIYYIASILKQIMTDTNNVIWVSQDLKATTVADGAVTSRLLEYLYMDFRAFTDAEEKHINCFDALEEILSTLNARLYQYYDNWIIERIDLKKENSDYEVYNSDGVYVNTHTADWIVALTPHVGAGTDIRFQNGASLEIEPAYKGYTVYQEYGNRKNLLEGLSYKLFKEYDWISDTSLRFWSAVGTVPIVREAELDAVRLKGISTGGTNWLKSNNIYLQNEGVDDLDSLMTAWVKGDITLMFSYEIRKQYQERRGLNNFVSNIALVTEFGANTYRANEDVEESGIGEWTPEEDLDWISYNLKDTNEWVMVSLEFPLPPEAEIGVVQTSILFRVLIQKCNTNLSIGDVVDSDGLQVRNMQLYFKATKDDDYAREYSPVISNENILEPERYDIKWGDTPAPFYGDGYGLINKHVIFDSAGNAVNLFGKGAGGSPTFNLVFNVLANDLELTYRIPRFKLRGTIIDTTYGNSIGGVDFRTILKDYDDRYYFPTGLSYNVKESTVSGEWVQMYDGSGTTGEFNDDFSDDFWT